MNHGVGDAIDVEVCFDLHRQTLMKQEREVPMVGYDFHVLTLRSAKTQTKASIVAGANITVRSQDWRCKRYRKLPLTLLHRKVIIDAVRQPGNIALSLCFHR